MGAQFGFYWHCAPKSQCPHRAWIAALARPVILAISHPIQAVDRSDFGAIGAVLITARETTNVRARLLREIVS